MGMEVMEMISIRIRQLGQLFRRAHITKRERTPAWAVVLASILYMGLSMRKISGYLALQGVERAHTAIWYWLQKLGEESLWLGEMPERIVVDGTGYRWVARVAGSSPPSIPGSRTLIVTFPAGTGG